MTRLDVFPPGEGHPYGSRRYFGPDPSATILQNPLDVSHLADGDSKLVDYHFSEGDMFLIGTGSKRKETLSRLTDAYTRLLAPAESREAVHYANNFSGGRAAVAEIVLCGWLRYMDDTAVLGLVLGFLEFGGRTGILKRLVLRFHFDTYPRMSRISEYDFAFAGAILDAAAKYPSIQHIQVIIEDEGDESEKFWYDLDGFLSSEVAIRLINDIQLYSYMSWKDAYWMPEAIAKLSRLERLAFRGASILNVLGVLEELPSTPCRLRELWLYPADDDLLDGVDEGDCLTSFLGSPLASSIKKFVYKSFVHRYIPGRGTYVAPFLSQLYSRMSALVTLDVIYGLLQDEEADLFLDFLKQNKTIKCLQLGIMCDICENLLHVLKHETTIPALEFSTIMDSRNGELMKQFLMHNQHLEKLTMGCGGSNHAASMADFAAALADNTTLRYLELFRLRGSALHQFFQVLEPNLHSLQHLTLSFDNLDEQAKAFITRVILMQGCSLSSMIIHERRPQNADEYWKRRLRESMWSNNTIESLIIDPMESEDFEFSNGIREYTIRNRFAKAATALRDSDDSLSLSEALIKVRRDIQRLSTGQGLGGLEGQVGAAAWLNVLYNAILKDPNVLQKRQRE